MAYFQTKNSNLGKFWWVFQWKGLVYFMALFSAVWFILWSFGTFYGYLVYFSVLVCCTKKNLATLLSSRCVAVPSMPWRIFLTHLVMSLQKQIKQIQCQLFLARTYLLSGTPRHTNKQQI
jgi:hypothetical protein